MGEREGDDGEDGRVEEVREGDDDEVVPCAHGEVSRLVVAVASSSAAEEGTSVEGCLQHFQPLLHHPPQHHHHSANVAVAATAKLRTLLAD